MKRCILLLFLLCGCPQPLPPTPVPPPQPPPTTCGVASDCAPACANLAKIGCPEGANPKCAATCLRVVSWCLTDLHLPCLIAAYDAATARACGSVACGAL